MHRPYETLAMVLYGFVIYGLFFNESPAPILNKYGDVGSTIQRSAITFAYISGLFALYHIAERPGPDKKQIVIFYAIAFLNAFFNTLLCYVILGIQFAALHFVGTIVLYVGAWLNRSLRTDIHMKREEVLSAELDERLRYLRRGIEEIHKHQLKE